MSGTGRPTDVWELCAPRRLSNIDSYTEGDEYGLAPECPVCGRAVGMLQWIGQPHVRILSVGGPPDDMLFPPGCGDSIVVSERFLEFYQNHCATGLTSFEKVTLTGSRRCLNRIVGDYFRCSIARVGQIDYIQGRVTTANNVVCPFCGDDVSAIESGVYLREPVNLDFFTPWNYNSPLCSYKMGSLLSMTDMVLPRLSAGKDVHFGLWLTDRDNHQL